jgi:hypothetical protein
LRDSVSEQLAVYGRGFEVRSSRFSELRTLNVEFLIAPFSHISHVTHHGLWRWRTFSASCYILVIPLRDKDAERHLLDAAKAECAPFVEEAGRQMKLLEHTNLLEARSPEPRVTIQLSEPGRVHLVLRFPAPDRGRSRIEQAILRRFLAGPR